MNKTSSPPSSLSSPVSSMPFSRRVETPALEHAPARDWAAREAVSARGLNSSTILFAMAALFAVSATAVGLASGGSLLPHHPDTAGLELRGTLPAGDAKSTW